MNKNLFWLWAYILAPLLCLAFGLVILIKPSFGDIPTTNVPVFKVLGKEITRFPGGINITLTFINYDYNATSGSVWLPWERVWYGISLSGVPPNGTITEALLPFDVNGDGDLSDVFTVEYIDNKTARIDGTTAYAMDIPEQRTYYDDVGRYDALEKNSFALGSKNHTLYRVIYNPMWGSGYAGFGFESFFRDHSSPNIEFVIEHVGTSINSSTTAEITNMELNGTSIPYEFNWVSPWLDSGQWYVDNAYVYPLGFLESGATFTVKLTIMGEPSAYLFQAILNWSPDALHRYRFLVYDALDIPFAITGTVHREVNFESKTYYIDILTNSTISPTIAFNSTAKEISFSATIYSDYSKPTTYFWNISIPQNFLTDNPWTVTLDNEPIAFTPTTNGIHTFLYFNYTFTKGWFITSKISIKGTWAIPESPSDIFLPLFMVTTLLASMLCRRKQSKRLQTKSTRCEGGSR